MKPGVADIGRNLLLAWALQVAALGDFCPRPIQWRIAAASGIVDFRVEDCRRTGGIQAVRGKFRRVWVYRAVSV
jgi:hypothetical protein